MPVKTETSGTLRPFRCSCGHSWVDEDTPSGRACHACPGGKGKPFAGESADSLIKAVLEGDETPTLRHETKWRGTKIRSSGLNWGGTLKPFKTDTGVTVRTSANGDGISHKIYDGKQFVGHLSGFASDLGRYADQGTYFHVYRTEMHSEAHRGKGHWQSAIQHLAKLYPGGVHLTKYDTSTAAKKATRKIPGVIEDDDRFIIRGGQ